MPALVPVEERTLNYDRFVDLNILGAKAPRTDLQIYLNSFFLLDISTIKCYPVMERQTTVTA